MPIEFQCTSCNKTLRVPETAAGKQARCPGCEQVVAVPSATTPGAPPAAVGTPPAVGLNPYADSPGAPVGANPYAAPSAAAATPRVPHTIHGTGKLDASRAVSFAWALFKEHMGMLIGCFVILTVANQVISFAQQIVQMFALQGAGPPAAGGPSAAQWTILILTTIVFYLITQAVQTFLFTGLVNLQLHIARGQRADFGMLFSGGRWFLKTFLGNLLFGLMIGLGFVALIAPGIYLALRYWSFLHFIVDKDCGIIDSFKLAGEASKGNMGETFLLGLIGFGLCLLGLVMLCFGLLFTAPVIYLSATIAYLMMTAQQIRQPQVIG